MYLLMIARRISVDVVFLYTWTNTSEMNLFKKNEFLVDGSIYLGLSCSNVLCSADRNAHMDSVRDDITTLLCANKNNEPLQNMTVYLSWIFFFYLREGVILKWKRFLPNIFPISASNFRENSKGILANMGNLQYLYLPLIIHIIFSLRHKPKKMIYKKKLILCFQPDSFPARNCFGPLFCRERPGVPAKPGWGFWCP